MRIAGRLQLYYAAKPPDRAFVNETLSGMTAEQLEDLGLSVSEFGNAGDSLTLEGRGRIEVHLIGCPAVKRGMRTALVVEAEIAFQALSCLGDLARLHPDMILRGGGKGQCARSASNC